MLNYELGLGDDIDDQALLGADEDELLLSDEGKSQAESRNPYSELLKYCEFMFVSRRAGERCNQRGKAANAR